MVTLNFLVLWEVQNSGEMENHHVTDFFKLLHSIDQLSLIPN